MNLVGHAICRAGPGRVRLGAALAWKGRATHTAPLRRGGSVARQARTGPGSARLGRAKHTAPHWGGSSLAGRGVAGYGCAWLSMARCGESRLLTQRAVMPVAERRCWAGVGEPRLAPAERGHSHGVRSRASQSGELWRVDARLGMAGSGKASHTAAHNAAAVRRSAAVRGAACRCNGQPRSGGVWRGLHHLPSREGSFWHGMVRLGETSPGLDGLGMATTPSGNGRQFYGELRRGEARPAEASRWLPTLSERGAAF